LIFFKGEEQKEMQIATMIYLEKEFFAKITNRFEVEIEEFVIKNNIDKYYHDQKDSNKKTIEQEPEATLQEIPFNIYFYERCFVLLIALISGRNEATEHDQKGIQHERCQPTLAEMRDLLHREVDHGRTHGQSVLRKRHRRQPGHERDQPPHHYLRGGDNELHGNS